MVSTGHADEVVTDESGTGALRPLFEARVRYVDGLEPVVSGAGREGELVGSGVGTVAGERLHGTIRWSFYAGDCAYLDVRAGVDPPPGRHLCTANPGGVIQTDDGARIAFDARGFGLKGYDPARPHLWRLTMALRLGSDDPRYGWVEETLGVMTSHFDDRAGEATWRAWIFG